MVDLDVVTFLQGLPKQTRDRLVQHFKRLRLSPETLSEGSRQDSAGRRTEISVFAGFTVHYWIDHADRHIKILELRAAGGSGNR